jgi:hypothetical protein
MTLAVCVLLGQVATAFRLPAALKAGALGTWLTLTAAAVVFWPLKIDHHDKHRLRAETALRNIRGAIRARPPGDVYLRLGPWAMEIFMIFYPDDTVDGRRVFFVSDKPFPPRLRRTRTPSLVVTSEQAARAEAKKQPR